MLGKAVEAVGRRRAAAQVDRASRRRVEGLRADAIERISFEVAPGEVVGLTGLPGSGFEAVAQLVTGGRQPQAGTLDHGRTAASTWPGPTSPRAWRWAPPSCPRSGSSRGSPWS